VITLEERSSNIVVNIINQYQSTAGEVEVQTMLNIPPELEAGDYTLHFVLMAGEVYCGELPCTIHVIK
jgi:hypothetical protein